MTFQVLPSLRIYSVDAGADYLEFDYTNAGSGLYGSAFKTNYVFTFTAPVALQITDVAIDSRTTLPLTSDLVTFSGNELSVNVRGLSFNPASRIRLNLTTAAVPDTVSDPVLDLIPESDTAAVPEPSTMLMLGAATVVGTLFKRHTRLQKSQEHK